MTAAEIQRVAAMLRRARRVLFITGAGMSADSGLPTYRGIGGLYEVAPTEEGLAIEDALSGAMLREQPAVCWRYIHQIESACRGAAPNAGHEIIAKLQHRVDSLWVLTQNVDGLHARAGSQQVIEIHGNIHRLDCTAAGCAWGQTVDDYAGLEPLPRCPTCRAVVRPRVVLFNELLPEGALQTLRQQMELGFDLVVSVGTTSAFPYVAAPVLAARAAGSDTVEINPGSSEVSSVVALRVCAAATPTLQALWDAVA